MNRKGRVEMNGKQHKDRLDDSSSEFSKALAKVLEVTEEQGYFDGWDQAFSLSQALYRTDFEDDVGELLFYAMDELEKQNPKVTNKEVLFSYPIHELIALFERKLDCKFNFTEKKTLSNGENVNEG